METQTKPSRSGTTRKRMEANPLVAGSGVVTQPTKSEPAFNTSQQKKSHLMSGEDTPLPLRLSFIQLMVSEYKKFGGNVEIRQLSPAQDGTKRVAIVLHDVDVIDGDFVMQNFSGND